MRARRFSSAELFAILVSMVSVTISVLGNRTQERLLAASVWAYLSFSSGNTTDDGQKQVVALEVTNSGNGPARIKRFALEHDGASVASASVLLERCCGLRPDNVVTSPIVGKVLRPGDKVMLLQVPFANETADGWRKLDHARFGLVYSACYCSTLNECWNVRSDRDEPESVAVCAEMSPDQQWHG
jgi:hypothetical protein